MTSISIIVPVYKVEKYISRCIESILSQIYSDFELILINDGSPDNSGAICDKYANLDKRIKVVHKENGGVSSARNVGLNIAQGEYIGFVDGDDWIEPDMFHFLYCQIIRNKADISICGASSTNILVNSKSDLLLNSEESVKELLKNGLIDGSIWNKLYRATLFENLRFNEDISIAEDHLLTYLILKETKLVVYNPSEKYHYMLTPDSAMRKPFERKDLSCLVAHEIILNDVKKHFPKLYNIACCRYLSDNIEMILRMIRSNIIDAQEKENIINNIKKYLLKYIGSPHIKLKMKLYSILMSTNMKLFTHLYKKIVSK